MYFTRRNHAIQQALLKVGFPNAQKRIDSILIPCSLFMVDDWGLDGVTFADQQVNVNGPNQQMMSFTDSIRICFRKYFDFKGRASRSEFWWFTLFLVCCGTVTGTIDALLFGWEFSDPTPLTNIATIVTLIPSFSVSWRRLHDVGKSGWWILISLTIIGLIPLIIWCIRASDNPNQYGEIPTNYLN